jgi:hypothetical protein
LIFAYTQNAPNANKRAGSRFSASGAENQHKSEMEKATKRSKMAYSILTTTAWAVLILVKAKCRER